MITNSKYVTLLGRAANVLAAVPWVAQWKFNNDGQDSIGTNHLTHNNSATFTTGKLGGATGATQLVAASSQYWSVADNAALSTGNVDFTICAWVYLDSVVGLRVITSKWDSAASLEWILYYNGTFNFGWTTDGVTPFFVVGNTFGVATAGIWYCVIAGHDATLNLTFISVNDGAQDVLSVTGGFNTNSTVRLGVYLNALQGFLDGRIDNVCIAKSTAGGGGVLTAAQRTAFYNAGVGTEVLA